MSIAAGIILGPLVAPLLIVLIRRWSAALAVAGALVGLLAASQTLVRVVRGETPAAELPGLPGLPLRLVVNPLGGLLALTVATVGLLVFIYAAGYMREERDQVRFFAGMAFFIAAMQALVLAGDWLLFLAAWELIGFASYLLIGFWFERPGVSGAATRAFATTRAADLGLYIGIMALVTAAGTTEIAATLEVGGTAATTAALGFLVATVGKSAQMPLQGWLLDAMVGPTPVSALLHSATLVVAGVVLLTRASPLLSPELHLLVGLVGGGTAILTGLSAIAQWDLKRLLASSTSSQIGLMLLALSAGSTGAAILHLVASAAMKSALFLGAGVFQHARQSTDFADLAGVGRERRPAFIAVVVAGLALAGIPPLAGFWTKDAVIAAALLAPGRALFTPLAWGASILTGIYVGRMLRLLWQPDGDHGQAQHRADPAAISMALGLGSLGTLVILFGLAVKPIGALLGIEIPENSLALALGMLAAVIGLTVGWLVGAGRLRDPAHGVAFAGFRVDDGLDGLVVRPTLAIAGAANGLDRALHAAVLGTGSRVLELAAMAWRLDHVIHDTVLDVGRWTLGLAGMAWRLDRVISALVDAVGTVALILARASRLSDETGIEALIASVVTGTRGLGTRARLLQSGLVHRELLVAAGATALVLLFVLLS